MMDNTLITIIGIIVGFLQGIILYVLNSIKQDQADMWKRMNRHYHEATCDNPDCRNLKTGNVIIPSGGSD